MESRMGHETFWTFTTENVYLSLLIPPCTDRVTIFMIPLGSKSAPKSSIVLKANQILACPVWISPLKYSSEILLLLNYFGLYCSRFSLTLRND